MKNNWLFKYRYEFPLLICVLTTINYTFGRDIFLLFNPNYSLLLSVLIATSGFGIHMFFGRISGKDDFQFNHTLISQHTRFIGDYFYWLSCAFFSGSYVVIIVYSVTYIIIYGSLIKRNYANSESEISKKMACRRGINNFLLISIAFLYISSLKSFIVTNNLTPGSWVKLLSMVALALFLFLLFVTNKEKNKKKNTTKFSEITKKIDEAEKDTTEGMKIKEPIGVAKLETGVKNTSKRNKPTRNGSKLK